jgi:hypothetical protein
MRQLIRVQVPAWAPISLETRKAARGWAAVSMFGAGTIDASGAVSSDWSERLAYTEDAGGSSPSPPTTPLVTRCAGRPLVD